MAHVKGLIRVGNRRGVASGRNETTAAGRPAKGTIVVCERCGAVREARL